MDTLVLLIFALQLAAIQAAADGCTDTIPVKECEYMRDSGSCKTDAKILKGKCDYTCGWCKEAGWSNWGTWAKCSKTCDKGQTYRRRTCTGKGCSGKNFEAGYCEIKPCSEGWKPWSDWTSCTGSCKNGGKGTRHRKRECSVSPAAAKGKGMCQGVKLDQEDCTLKCATWSSWGDWQSCSVTCGRGRKSRRRTCENGPKCPGQAMQRKTCQMPDCSGGGLQFDKWTTCTKSCDSGTKIKLISCDDMDLNTCPKEYADCNTFPCPTMTAQCRGLYRYEGKGEQSYSSCCKVTDKTCGTNAYQDISRIVGGRVSEAKQFPWMARIEVTRTSQIDVTTDHICGGTLIHPQYVVTAAHCFDHVKDSKRFVLIFGSTSRTDESSYVQTIGAESISVHPKYRNPVNDIAIIKLKKPVQISDYVNIICLPRGEVTPPDEKCFIAGWGGTETAKVASDLMEARVRHLPFDFCKQERWGSRSSMDESLMMCAGTVKGGIDTCQGDSGGPLMCQRCASCGWYLAGITSFGKYECEEGNGGVYTRVSAFEDWIATMVKPSQTKKYSCRKRRN